MAKQKEIKFQDRHGALRGRQNGMEFWIRKDEPQTGSGEQRYFVAIYPVSNNPQQINTLSRQDFDLAGAKEFCQKIAAGEIKLEDLQAAYDAEDAAKEQAAIRDVTERAKKFHARLDAMGLKYRDLLELEVLAHSLGNMGHNILLGYERGEGWPETADTRKGTADHVVEVQGRQSGETGQEFVGKVKQIIQDLSGSRRSFQ